MATNKRPVMIRVQPLNYEKLKAIAAKNRRSLSNQIEFLMESFIDSYETTYGQIQIADNGEGNNGSVINNQQVGSNISFVNGK